MRESDYIKQFTRFGLVVAIAAFLCGCQNYNRKKLQSDINRVSAQWIPDKRVAICDVKVKFGKNGTVILYGETTISKAKEAIIKTLDSNIKALSDSIIILPDTLRNKKFMGLVTLSVINLRKEPDDAAELVSQAKLGTPVLILKNRNSWLLIQTPDNYIAWTEGYSVTPLTRKEMTSWKKVPKVICMENTGWLYETAKDNSGVVGDLVGGSIMEKTGELNSYFSVVLPDGRRGFIEKNKVKNFDIWKKSAACTEDNICNVSKTFLGLPYLWGGTSAKAVDCSGFVQSVYFMNGSVLARDASLQVLYGKDVDISDGYSRLKRGDLLFFGPIRNGIPRVTHVAIYLGDNEYINASGRVMVNSLDSTKSNYKKNSLLRAKRIIGVENDRGIVPVYKHPWY